MKNKFLAVLATGLFMVGMVAMANATPIYIDNLDSANVIKNPIEGWRSSTSVFGYNGSDYEHDNNGAATDFTFLIGNVVTGTYNLELLWTSHANRGITVPITIFSAGGTQTYSINQQGPNGPASYDFGTFSFDSASYLKIGTLNAGGYVIADAVKLDPVPEPATMLLFGTGLIGLAGVARRKKK